MMKLFSQKVPSPSALEVSGPDGNGSEVLALQKEFGQFLVEQLQEQASALLTLGTSMVVQPSEHMVSAMAVSWLVQHMDWKGAIVYGVKEKALVAYAAYPASPVASASADLAAAPFLVDAALHGKRIFASKLKDDAGTALLAALGGDEVYGVPLAMGQGAKGYLLISGPSGFQDAASSLATDIAGSLSLASTLAELARQTQKFRELDEIRNSFISTTSHQLRTPLSVVKWMFSVFLTDPELNKMESQMQMIKQAYAGVERIIDVVNDLLNVSRIQDGRLPYMPQLSDPKQVIHNVTEDVRPILESRKLKLSLEVGELQQFEFDPILLREALQNLVNNAVDYNVDGGAVTIAAHESEGTLSIKVTNTGSGIKPEQAGRVFTPMYRSPEAVLMHPDGSGLGLYLAKAIASAHGGTITFESVPDKETAFTLSIPMAPPKAA